MAQPPEYPPLNEDQQKAVDAANKIVTVLNDPQTEKAAKDSGLAGAFFAKGTANYSTADFTKVVAVTVATTLPRLLASGGTDVSAWAQLGVGLLKAFTDAGKALSKLAKNDVVYEQLYRDYPFLTYTCTNNRLDFQNVLVNCANARQKAEKYLEATKNDPLFLQKLYTYLYLKFGARKSGTYQGVNLYLPNVETGKVERIFQDIVSYDQKSQDVAFFLGQVSHYNLYLDNPFKLPFYIAFAAVMSPEILQACKDFMYYYENNMLDANFEFMTIMFTNAGFPNPETLTDETRANNYFFESFRTAAKKLEEERLAKEQQEKETNYYYYVAGFIILVLAIYYFFFSKK